MQLVPYSDPSTCSRRLLGPREQLRVTRVQVQRRKVCSPSKCLLGPPWSQELSWGWGGGGGLRLRGIRVWGVGRGTGHSHRLVRSRECDRRSVGSGLRAWGDEWRGPAPGDVDATSVPETGHMASGGTAQGRE